MSERTEIAWCDSTFNPWIGCTKVGPGCDNCYAEREFDHRHHKAKWGPGQERVRTSAHNWRQPIRWNAKPFAECPACGHRGEPNMVSGLSPEGQMMVCPQCHNGPMKPARRRVFSGSLCDVFDNEVPAQWRADLFRLIADTPNLDWLILTKRIGNASRMIAEATAHVELEDDSVGEWASSKPWPNVWLGATICNQTEADRDIPKLLAVPAAVRFVSMEPLLGSVTLREVHSDVCEIDALTGDHGVLRPLRGRSDAKVHWVIVGGESGPKARPMHPDWVRSLRDQCQAAGVPFLFKQWGEWANASCGIGWPQENLDCGVLRHDGLLVNPATEAVVRGEYRGEPRAHVIRVGKKLAGRLLDGKIHNEFPEGRP